MSGGDLDWNDYAGPMGSQKDSDGFDNNNEFDNIKVNLGAKSKYDGLGSIDMKNTNQPKENDLRKSNASSDTGSHNEESIKMLEKKSKRWCNCFHVDHYQEYFNVTTQDVLQRLLFSLIPFRSKLVDAINNNPDIYGPFWIYATMIYLLGYAENMHNYWTVGSKNFEYDFKSVSTAFFVVYGVGFGVPLALAFLMKYVSETQLKFIEVQCIYGYAFSSI